MSHGRFTRTRSLAQGLRKTQSFGNEYCGENFLMFHHGEHSLLGIIELEKKFCGV